MEYVYLSPHLDDIALSCGGLAWEQARVGNKVSVWTICAGFPPPDPLPPFAQHLHQRWVTGGETVAIRRQEDLRACAHMGVTCRHFDLPDCIYRLKPDGSPLIGGEDDLWEGTPEAVRVAELADLLRANIPAGTQVVSPLGLGYHIDHRLVRQAAEAAGFSLLYYMDYPYILRSAAELSNLEGGPCADPALLPTGKPVRSPLPLQDAGWQRLPAAISLAGLEAWQKAVWAYPSQTPGFWASRKEMRVAYRNYWAAGGGRLWTRRP
jgi:LmbE family N-acetylglucosaminyl deacetylase